MAETLRARSQGTFDLPEGTLFVMENLEDAKAAGRAIGDQFRVAQAPSLPTDPLGPGLAKMTVSGACAGLALSIVAVIWRKHPPST